MGKWMAFMGIAAGVFLYDPPWAMQQLDYFVRMGRLW